MESTIAAQCIVEHDTGLVLDMAGNKLPAGSVIMCKVTTFVIMEDSDIDYMGGGKMEMVYKADDSTSSSSISRSRSCTWKEVKSSLQASSGP